MFKKLSDTELFIMEELWALQRPMSARELEQWFLGKGIEWKIQTISTFLTRMEQKGYIRSEKCGREKVYFPIVSREEFQGKEARGLLENYYEGSLQKFLIALSDGALSEEKAKELEEWLEEQKG